MGPREAARQQWLSSYLTPRSWELTNQYFSAPRPKVKQRIFSNSSKSVPGV